MIGQFRKAVEGCNLILGMISGLGVLAMGFVIVYEVVCRYLFNSPTIWAQEISIYLYMWTMLAASSYTLQMKKHVNVDLVVDKLSGQVKTFTEIVSSTIGAIFCAIVSVQAYEMIAASVHFGKVSATPLRVPLWIPQSALLIGFVLLTFQFTFTIVERVAAMIPQKRGKDSLL